MKAVVALADDLRVAPIDVIAALAMLGKEIGREYLTAASTNADLSATARDYAERGLRILAWKERPEGRSPWTA